MMLGLSRIPIVALILCTLFLSHRCLALEAMVHAPTDCSSITDCNLDITTEEIGKSWSEAKNERDDCLKGISDEHSREDNDTYRYLKCRIHPAVFEDICQSRLSQAREYIWVPSSYAIDGDLVVENLSKRLAAGSILSDEIFVLTPGSVEEEQHVARCNVRTISGITGPPSDCIVVAVKTRENFYFRSGVYTGHCLFSATNRINGAIDIKFEIETIKPLVEFYDNVKRKLSEDLELKIESNETLDELGHVVSVSIRSTAPLRESKIISGGWRESFNFDVYIGREEKNIVFRGSTQPMICRYSVGEARYYHGLDDDQRAVYMTRLDKLLENAIRSACTVFDKKDDERAICK